MAKRQRRRKKEEEIEEEALEEVLEEEPQEEKKKKRKKARDAGKESSVIYKTGEMPKLRGGGVAKKLAFYMSAAILLIMVVVCIVMFIVVSGAVDEQINAGGVVAARLLAAPDIDIWKRFYGMEVDGTVTDEQMPQMKFNQSRLHNVLEDPILNATIYAMSERGTLVIRRTGCDPFMEMESAPQFNPMSGKKSLQVGEVKVEHGFISIENRRYSCRSYMAPIKDYEGNLQGYSQVVLSEDQIDAQKWSLLGTIVILTFVFVGIGIGMAFFMGRKITEPIKNLIEDITIVAGGDLNHHTVPRSQDEIGLVARTFDKMTKNLVDAQTREIELAAQKHQMAVAQEVQANLLPTRIPEVPGYEVMAYHRSSKEVDGNYYDVIQYPDGQVGVLVASASGKGFPAAMVMTMARSFFRALVSGFQDPVAMMREANRLLSPDLRAGMYVEVLMVLLDPKNHKAKLISAGPTSLFRYNFATKKLQAIHGEGIALGFDKGPVFDKSLKEVEFEINPGDRLVLNTPGLFTIKNPDGVEIGTMGFAKAVNKHATKNSDAFVNLVVNVLDNFAGKEVDDTDIAFLTVRRKEA